MHKLYEFVDMTRMDAFCLNEQGPFALAENEVSDDLRREAIVVLTLDESASFIQEFSFEPGQEDYLWV